MYVYLLITSTINKVYIVLLFYLILMSFANLLSNFSFHFSQTDVQPDEPSEAEGAEGPWWHDHSERAQCSYPPHVYTLSSEMPEFVYNWIFEKKELIDHYFGN